MAMTKKITLLLCSIIVFVLSSAGMGLAATTYAWKDIDKQLEIVGGHKMKNGDLIVKVQIPSYVVDSAKKINFYIKFTGFRSGGYGDYFRLRINDSVQKYSVYPKIRIATKYLRPGLNDFIFSDYTSSYHTSSHVIWKLGFADILAPGRKDPEAIAKLEKDDKVEIAQIVSVPSKETSAALEWKDIDKAFEVKGGHKLMKGPLIVNLDISREMIEASEKIKFYIDISGTPAPNDSSKLTINDAIYQYRIYPHITIFTKHLKPGLNVFKFDDPGRGYYGEGLTVEKISFSQIESRDDVAKNIEDIQREKKIQPSQVAPGTSSVTSPVLSKLNPKKSQNTAMNVDSIAVVIGNQAYSHRDVPSVDYADNDAMAIKRFLVDTLGYLDGNIIFQTDTTKAELEKIFGTKDNHRGLLFNYVKPGKSEVFIYYSGHGAPDPTTNQAYLVPIDCDPVMMGLTAYPLNALYGNLPKIEAKRVTVVIDACFSGGTNTGKWLVKNASPALIKVNSPVSIQNDLTIFTSAKNNQVSSWYPEKQHSMFTYFFLKAITGDADVNTDGKITYQEIYDFVANRTDGVPYYAKRLHGGRIQMPVMHAADKDAVFVSY
jgi:hypothetical protein